MIARPRFRPAFGVALLLALYWFMAASVSSRLGLTADEPGHLTAGYAYWRFNDYRLNPENGTLPMRLAALPLLALPVEYPSLRSAAWVRSSTVGVADELFFARANPVADMMQCSRATIALVGVFTLWLIWRWARGLFGVRAGWLALALAAFCPALLAHGGLATSDMMVTAGFLAALSAVWRLLHRVTVGRVLVAALACGLLFTAKMSGVLIVPLIGAMLAVRWSRRAPLVVAWRGPVRWLRRRGMARLASVGALGAVAAGSLVVLWASYGFRYEGFARERSRAEGYYFSWDVVLQRAPVPWQDDSALAAFVAPRRPPEPGALLHLVGWLRDRRLLPEAYLWGFAHTLTFARERPAFFRGEFSRTGWAAFFPTAFIMKTPAPTLIAGAAGLAALAWGASRARERRRRVRWLYRAAPLLLFFASYWLLALNMNLNIGHRHILPTYPVVYILASAAVRWLGAAHGRAVAGGLVALVALQAVESLAARPFYLSYFQPIFGGPARAYRTFVDSSLDWGQGLPALARWQQERRAAGDRRPLFLSYAGVDLPRRYRIEATRFGDAAYDLGPRAFPAPLRAGWYAISATQFQRVYLPVRGDWLPAHEELYRELGARLRQPAGGDERRAVQDRRDFEVLQLGRLCRFLRDRVPDDFVGGSLLLFRLDEAELAQALQGPLPGGAP